MSKISKPGIYRLSMDAYHGQPCVGLSVSSSVLRTLFNSSPMHAYDQWSGNPACEPRTDTAAFTLGRAAHHLLLGEDDYNTHYIARPETLDGAAWQGNRTACKAWVAKQNNAGRTVLTPDQIATIRGMARSLAKFPLVQAGVLNGAIEQSIVWQDKKTGLWLKVRPDAIPGDSGDFSDLKTSAGSGEELDKAIFGSYRYDMQAALVAWACREVLKREMASFTFVFVESKRPFSCDALTLESHDLEGAEEDLRVAIDTFAMCLRTGQWFGPSGTLDARRAVCPTWARRNADYRRGVLKQELLANKEE